ncbi:NINE protein [Silvimonas sp.]|uniref:NINE protein n=1 Tax=Silvimonas sp. TaxID=2650811 RepID=UPI00386F8283
MQHESNLCETSPKLTANKQYKIIRIKASPRPGICQPPQRKYSPLVLWVTWLFLGLFGTHWWLMGKHSKALTMLLLTNAFAGLMGLSYLLSGLEPMTAYRPLAACCAIFAFILGLLLFWKWLSGITAIIKHARSLSGQCDDQRGPNACPYRCPHCALRPPFTDNVARFSINQR